MKPILFIGGGRITSALIAGLRLADNRKPIAVHDRNPRKLSRLEREFAVIPQKELRTAIDAAGLLLIAVRPDSVPELLQRIGRVERPILAVSLAAGVPLRNLRARLGPQVRWARAMPSPACRTGRGLTAVTFDRKLSTPDRARIKRLFAQVGTVLEIAESKFDAFTVTYSCSHGYHALATLAQAAQRVGLDQKTALTAAAHALADGILSWREGTVSLEGLLHEAATPGGIAAATMAAMDDAGFKRAVERGLMAGLARARANAKL